MTMERRAKPRDSISLPIVLADGTTATTRNLSEDGIYFLVSPGVEVDDWLSFEFAAPQLGLRFLAAGEVLRREPGPDGTGIAMRLHGPRLFPLN
jgi:hypothetical protein